jgi:hypothetical protein
MNDTGIDGYRAYLARRDGEADLLNRRLASREEFFGGLEADPVRSAHPIDRDVFMRNLRRRRPEPGVDRKMLFLLATAKLNQAERFGVGLGETYGLNSGDDLPPERVYMELEEHYHTRLLAYVLDIFGLPFQVVAPPFVMRQFVKTAVFLPERVSFMFVGPRKWRAASCSTSCAGSAASCSPTNQRWPLGSSGSTPRSSRTKWGTSATAPRAVPRRSGRSCVAFTRESDGCLQHRHMRSAFSPIASTFTPVSIGPLTSRSSQPACRTKHSLPLIPDERRLWAKVKGRISAALLLRSFRCPFGFADNGFADNGRSLGSSMSGSHRGSGEPTMNRVKEAAAAKEQEYQEGARQLREFATFAKFSDSDLQRIVRAARRTSTAGPWPLIREQTISDACYILLSGEAGVYVGQDRIAVVGPGEVIGESAIRRGKLRNATVTTTGKAEVLHVARDDLDRLLNEIPALRETMDATVARHVPDQTVDPS